MRLLYLNRGNALACVAVFVSTAFGGDFRVTNGSKDSGVSDSGGRKVAGGSSADSGASGGSDTGGAASGGHAGHGNGGATTRGGGASNGGADAGGDGGAATGGAGNGGAGTGGAGDGGSAGSGNGGTASGGASTGGRGGAGGANGGAAGTSHSQFVRDYDRKCTYDSDCTLVFQGQDVCTCDAQCPNASIANSALAQWNKDRQAMMCVALPCAKQNCTPLVASCGANTCYPRKPLIIDASHYDQTCLTAADCTTIVTGEVCSPCTCSRGAVSNKGYQDYLKDKQSVQCSPGPVACDCAPQPTTLTCTISVSGSGVGKCTLSLAATTN